MNALADQQNRNQRRTVLVRIDGVIIPFQKAAEKVGLSADVVRSRVWAYGWPLHRALELKVNQTAEIVRGKPPRSRYASKSVSVGRVSP
jgi:hypothetical protein